MAGDWIKVETNTATKPEVVKIARLLGMDRFSVLGRLIHFWAWIDAVSVDGVVDGVVDGDVDALVDATGFANALSTVGWIVIHRQKERIEVVNFDRHNGKSAKERALKRERQRRWRDGRVDGDVDGGVSTREEKRRNKTPKPPLGGFSSADAEKKNGARYDLSTDAKVAAAWKSALGRDPPAGKSLDECRSLFWQKLKEARH